ncbi:TPA: hypothetical protein N0F65_012274 [Lagenidium giganteum]|uniref:peptidylprolyl isomerase n=1 Tax=Lagenidium giganteum TaxID=4803 RepID=A0AAV2ZB83_9STRA|nr:TPA: hypothetical protein N0F65_012274 [Lagenidium giganteum]
MVLMRRKDKRRDNAEDNLEVASDGITANKGFRSLQGARTGRFAADMRVAVGGYGRQDKTWGVDHPWHKTQEDVYQVLCQRDHMEEGLAVKEEPKPQAKGESRAALKRKKAKMKKGVVPQQPAEAPGPEEKPQTPEPKPSATKVKTEEKVGNGAKDGKPEPSTTTAGKKQQKRKRANDKEAVEEGKKSKEEQVAEDEAEAATKPESKKSRMEKKAKEQETEKARREADMLDRQQTAKEYDGAFGYPITTPSGLIIEDKRLGHGRLPEVGEMLTVRYRGRLGKDGLVFGKGMLTPHFGMGTLIRGWEEGLSTMRTGGVRCMTIPPELAYGESGKGDKIPPNATLHFEVELVRIGKRQRDVVDDDEIPLPSAFQRKRKKAKQEQNQPATETLTKSQKKRIRRNRRKAFEKAQETEE